MRKNQINAALTEYEIRRNKMISKVRYKIEQYFGITEKYHGAGKAKLTPLRLGSIFVLYFNEDFCNWLAI